MGKDIQIQFCSKTSRSPVHTAPSFIVASQGYAPKVELTPKTQSGNTRDLSEEAESRAKPFIMHQPLRVLALNIAYRCFVSFSFDT